MSLTPLDIRRNDRYRRLLADNLYTPAFSFSAPREDGVIVMDDNAASATFSRATTATFTDYEGIIRTVPAAEARMEGARRVENLVLHSEDFDEWLVGEGATPAGKTITFATSQTSRMFQDLVVSSGTTIIISASFAASDAGKVFRFGVFDGAWDYGTTLTVPANGGVVSRTFTADANTTYVGVVSSSPNAAGTTLTLLTGVQVENVTGQSDTVTPGPYVPTTTAAASRYYSTTPSQRVDTNLCLQSQNFSTTWAAQRCAVTIDATTAPDGTISADKIDNNNLGSGSSGCYQVVTKAASALQYTFSCYIKKGTKTWASLWVANNAEADRAYAYFDVENGVTGSAVQGTTFTLSSHSIEDAGLGWYRCSVTVTTDATTVITGIVRLADSDGDYSVTSGLDQTIYVWGAQLEEVTGIPSTYPSDYIPTTTAAVSELQDIKSFMLRPDGTTLGIKRYHTYAPWEAAETVALGQRRYVEVGGLGYYANCITAGTTGGTEPTWVADGTSIADNTAAWAIDDTNFYRLKGMKIEEARTNVCLQSEDLGTSWVAGASAFNTNQTTAPDGTLTADRLIDLSTGGTGADVSARTLGETVTAGSNTFSIYAKADQLGWTIIRTFGYDAGGSGETSFDLITGAVGATSANHTATISDAGNGWYRCSITFSTTTDLSGFTYIYAADGNNDRTVDLDGTSSIFVWGAQLEAGAAPSTYIPTTTAPVTRNAEALTYPTAGWYSDAAGSVLSTAEVMYPGTSPNARVYNFGTLAGNIVGLYKSTPNASSIFYSASSGGDAMVMSGFAQGDAEVIDALGYASNDCYSSSNGTAHSPDTIATFPIASTPSAMQVGSYLAGASNNLNGNLLNLAYIPQRISDADLVILSKREHSND